MFNKCLLVLTAISALILTACGGSSSSSSPLGYYAPTGTPTPATVFDTIAETYNFNNNLTNSIWQRQADIIVTGHYNSSGYWAFASKTAVYPDNPDQGTDIHARMVQIPATNTVIYSLSPSADGVGLGTYDKIAVATISTTTGLLTAGQAAVFGDSFTGACQLTSSSATEFLCYDGTVIRRYLTTEGSPTLTANGTISLSTALPVAAQCAPGASCYGSTFAFDGDYYYFAADQGSPSSLDYIVYDKNGMLVNTYTAAGSGAINGVYFDWSVGRYSTHDGYGGRSGSTVYGTWTGDDTHNFGPISAAHTLK